MDVVKAASRSVWNYLKLIFSSKLHLDKVRLGRSYHIGDQGEYLVFRETVSGAIIKEPHVVLVVGFRLKLLSTNRTAHKIFQKICILTTPFWSGFVGFHIKLWMVKHNTSSYLGIYDWAGKDNAIKYAETLCRVLRPLSTPDSVWYKIYEKDFEDYLLEHEYKLP